MQRDEHDSSSSLTATATARPFPPARKTLNRPGTWFGDRGFGKSSTSSNSSSNSSSTASGSSSTQINNASPTPFSIAAHSFRSPFPSSKGKHKLSPSPSPRNEEDFVMISPVRPPQFTTTNMGSASRMGRASAGSLFSQEDESGRSSSPPEDSPTPACGMASATARLRLADDDSPIRRVPGQSRSLKGAIEDGGRSIFMAGSGAGGDKRYPAPSPLKGVGGRMSMMDDEVDEDDLDGSPRMSTAPLMNAAPPPQPLFPPLRTSQSQDCEATSKSLFHPPKRQDGNESRIPRLSASHPLRARAATDADRPSLASKKAVSLDAIPSIDKDEPFGIPISTLGKKSRPSSSTGNMAMAGRAHKRINSGEYHNLNANSISRSFGQKSGLALSLTPSPGLGALPDLASNSSLSSMSTAGLTPPASAFAPAEPPIFEHVRPLAEAFAPPTTTVSRKFKPRDSGVAMGDDEPPKRSLVPPPSAMKPSHARPRRPPMLKRTSSMGDERSDLETPSLNPSMQSGWPGAAVVNNTTKPFDFLGEGGAGINFASGDKRPSMPDTPVKKHSYGHSHGGGPFGHRVSQSLSQPSLSATGTPLAETTRSNIPPAAAAASMVPPPTAKKPPASCMKVPHLTLTTTSSPGSPSGMDTDQSSPTVRVSSGGSGQTLTAAPASRVGLLRRQDSGAGSSESEEDGTPTKGGASGRVALAARPEVKTPTPSPAKSRVAATSTSGIYPRLSLPAFAAPKQHRTLHHRQSHPAAPTNLPEEEDLFEKRFITLDNLGKGAFSTVVKVQDRYGDGLYAVKKARGVFDGVKDRLRHLEEVDILRHLSKRAGGNPHVIRFEDAWEQNRQLFIQTELCLGTLAFFLEEYGRVVERLDEGRVWKIVRELSDGINHIHSSGVIHFDIKPANILISSTGSLKIGDFGLATRWPRISPAEIIHGSGLGGVVPAEARREKLEREGDRVYMPPEMLQGVFVMAADVFSFGLVILEVSTNICVPDGGAPWQALRTNDFSVVDLSPLSPALTDLIISCMSADPSCRPTMPHIVGHPIVQRARSGKEALAPEEARWVIEVLSGGSGFVPSPAAGGSAGAGMRIGGGAVGADGDVEMAD